MAKARAVKLPCGKDGGDSYDFRLSRRCHHTCRSKGGHAGPHQCHCGASWRSAPTKPLPRSRDETLHVLERELIRRGVISPTEPYPRAGGAERLF